MFYEAYSYGFWLMRLLHRVWYGQEPEHTIQIKNLPWLWIGAVYPHDTLNVNELIDKTVLPGMRVTPEYLSSVSGFVPESWKYLDPKTLEEKDFPSEGFVIEDETSTNQPIVTNDSA